MKYNDEELKKMIKKSSFDKIKEHIETLEHTIQKKQEVIDSQEQLINKLKDEIYDLQCNSKKLDDIVESNNYKLFQVLNKYIEHKFDEMLYKKNPCEECYNYDIHSSLES